MDFLTVLGFCIVIYFLIYFAALFVGDCDLELMYAEKFGKKLGKLCGKVIWITDATNNIGEAMAYRIARNDGKLILTSKNREKLEEMKKTCLGLSRILNESDVLILEIDLMDVPLHQKIFDQVKQHFGRIDILINNNNQSLKEPWYLTGYEQDRQIFEQNVFSTISLTRIALKYFNGRGKIAVLSSLAGLIGVPNSSSYTGAKHAIHGYYDSLRIEKLGQNVQVTILCPGPISLKTTEELNDFKSSITNFNEAERIKMSAERCAYLSLIAIVNKIDEAWMAPFPLLPLVYLMKYYPNVSKYLLRYSKAYMFEKSTDNKANHKKD